MELDFETWSPRVIEELRKVGAFQLSGAASLGPGDVHLKLDRGGEPSVVTRWDVESEAMLRDWVQRAFPGHSFLGEEGGNDRRDPEHYWLCDPIDGTTNFVDGIPYWGSSLAYWRAGRPVAGWVYFPALARLYAARAGGGATCDGRAIHTSTALEYTPLTTVGLDSRSHLRHVLRLRARVRILGSAVANQCLTADGRFLASVTRGKLWDVAAGVLLLREAGAAVECAPDLAVLDPSAYGCDGAPARSLTLHARGSAALPPLADFLHPARPAAPHRPSGTSP